MADQSSVNQASLQKIWLTNALGEFSQPLSGDIALDFRIADHFITPRACEYRSTPVRVVVVF